MPTRGVAGRLHSVNLPLLRLSCKSELFKYLSTGAISGVGPEPKIYLSEPAIEHQINKNTRY
jgi:hypothetical protein